MIIKMNTYPKDGGRHGLQMQAMRLRVGGEGGSSEVLPEVQILHVGGKRQEMNHQRKDYVDFKIEVTKTFMASQRAVTHVAIRQGKIKRKPCEICGGKLSIAHHPNYFKPFDIIWLCVSCHVNLHQAKPKTIYVFLKGDN